MVRRLHVRCWFKSSKSPSQDACVEIAWLSCAGHVGVRDSKDHSGAALVFGAAEWGRFSAALRSGRFDL
ncbi:DUF397 domain-containing protein [Nocardia sp. 2]|uniref:DUF397 domain-containing protein n=1 Tax=Nocardia acididurans TaxID=2802282 RepID=A0ABS1M8C7_9NOCA|nr:DUF397 domain-containing protein [Nocardia acididurans]MBL1076551.1 DUF397 domain-containing protein [Nocardia acididurans]